MKQEHISCGSVCDRFPSLVAQNLKAKDQCRTPAELLGKCIRGCFHGWVILSHQATWSLWNPVTSKTIRLPPLSLNDGDFESIEQCCLSSPPNDPHSVLMLTRSGKPTIVFCRLGRRRKGLRWKEMTYTKQLTSIIQDSGFLHCLTCYNGKVCALVHGYHNVIQVDIVVEEYEDAVSLSVLGKVPLPFRIGCSVTKFFLKGYCDDLFCIKLDFDQAAKRTLGAVFLFKLDTSRMMWEEMEDLKDAIFFLDLADECSVFYCNAIGSELGGYVHIRGRTGKVVYSYDVKDKTISLSSMACLEQWEYRLHGDRGKTECEAPEDDEVDIKNTENEESFEPHLLNIPFDVLKMIMEFCVGVEYLNFRATCKSCQLAAPMIQ